jgi:hypothetical protein
MLIIHIVRGKPPPDWRLGQIDITVNALISLVTELAKLSMSALIASILAQLKWLWFMEPRPLLDLQVHEDAVHGLWGSSTLLFRRKSRYENQEIYGFAHAEEALDQSPRSWGGSVYLDVSFHSSVYTTGPRCGYVTPSFDRSRRGVHSYCRGFIEMDWQQFCTK